MDLKNILDRDFPGGPVVKTLYFHCRGTLYFPWMGNEDSTCCVRPKNRKKNYIKKLKLNKNILDRKAYLN